MRMAVSDRSRRRPFYSSRAVDVQTGSAKQSQRTARERPQTGVRRRLLPPVKAGQVGGQSQKIDQFAGRHPLTALVEADARVILGQTIRGTSGPLL